ncbi:MAG: D-amino-acid transaminase [Sporomusaceae bacterium]|nr:D-amino-acid transaminase [Sporomusaceae bacterium]
MKALGLVDGRIVDLAENVVPMEDRGHQFGDGVYEVTRLYNGRLFAFQAHMERLFRSLRALRIPVVYTEEDLLSAHQALVDESGISDAGIYLQITRGVAPRAHNFPEHTVPRLSMSIRPANNVTATLAKTGAKALFTEDERWLRCDIKSLNLLGNVLAKQKAKENGCFEAILVRENGVVTEGTSSSFMVVKGGVIWTHPLTKLILPSVTRKIIIEKILPGLDLPIIEKTFDVAFAKTADEAFVCGTQTEIMPLIALDNQPVGNGEAGPITRKLQAAYQAIIDQECRR